jgi:hypothetical protein
MRVSRRSPGCRNRARVHDIVSEAGGRDPTGTLIEIPMESILEVEGEVAHSGLINVLWNGEAFSVFYEDLRESVEALSPVKA